MRWGWEKDCLINAMKKRKWSLFGLVKRHKSLEGTIMEGKRRGKTGRKTE